MVLNLSSIEFSNLELTILAYGLDHCIPSHSIKCEEICSKFEVLVYRNGLKSPQLCKHVSDLKARLNDLAHVYVGTPVSSWESEQISMPGRVVASQQEKETEISDQKPPFVFNNYPLHLFKLTICNISSLKTAIFFFFLFLQLKIFFDFSSQK